MAVKCVRQQVRTAELGGGAAWDINIVGMWDTGVQEAGAEAQHGWKRLIHESPSPSTELLQTPPHPCHEGNISERLRLLWPRVHRLLHEHHRGMGMHSELCIMGFACCSCQGNLKDSLFVFGFCMPTMGEKMSRREDCEEKSMGNVAAVLFLRFRSGRGLSVLEFDVTMGRATSIFPCSRVKEGPHLCL